MAKGIKIISTSAPTKEAVAMVNIDLQNPDHNNSNVTIAELKKTMVDSLGTYQVDGIRDIEQGKSALKGTIVLLDGSILEGTIARYSRDASGKDEENNSINANDQFELQITNRTAPAGVKFHRRGQIKVGSRPVIKLSDVATISLKIHPIVNTATSEISDSFQTLPGQNN